jgi:sugar lactone lactonase YvrE
VTPGNATATSRWDSDDQAPPETGPGWVHEVMVPPSLLFGANGIRVTPAGELWITQTLGDRITSWNPATRRFATVSGARHGMSAPDDLAFDSAARCYFSQPRDGQVSVRDPSGALAILVDGLPEANGITVTPDDRLFVDECRSGGRLLEVSTDGSAPARTVMSGIGMPNALEMGPDRRLYLPEIETGRILAVEPDSGHATPALEGVAVPSAVKFDASGRLVVSEAATGELAATDLATGRRQVLAACDPGLDNFAFDGRGGVFISNFVTGSVVIVDLSSGVERVVHPAGLLGPCSLSAGPDGAILVGDWMSVAEIGTNGGLRRVAQVPIDFVFSVVGAVDVDGALVVLSSEGQLFWRGSDRSAFVPLDVGDAPVSALCSTRAGALAAAGGRIVHLGPKGATGDPLDAGLNLITALAAHETAVAAADGAQGRVVVLDAGGEQSWTGFDDPRGVAITERSVYVAESGARRIVRVDRGGGDRSVVATVMPFGSPVPGHRLRIGSPSLLAAGEDCVVVGCDGDGSVRRLRARH